MPQWKRVKVNDEDDVDGFMGLEVLIDSNNEEESSTIEITENSDVETDDESTIKTTSIINNEIEIKNDSEWFKYGLGSVLVNSLLSNGFESPLPVQELTLKKAVHMRTDTVVAAETGSGKTLTYVIPILHQILCIRKSCNEISDKANQCVRAIIMTPTRELATQVHAQIMQLSKSLHIYSIAIIGGISARKHERLLSKHPEIIVATPGRLWSYLDTNKDNAEQTQSYLSNLNGMKVFVVDEVDRMVENGHYDELEKICATINKVNNVKKFVLSATLKIDIMKSSDGQKKFKRNAPSRIDNCQQKIIHELKINLKKANLIDISKKNMTPDTLKEYRVLCEENEKEFYLYQFLKEHSTDKNLVFFNKVESVKRIGALFGYLKRKPMLLYGKQMQRKRFEAVENFNSNNALLFTTDIAARGLDFTNVDNVIHFDVPLSGDSYIHRSGRTARCFKEGLSLILLTAPEIHKYQDILKKLNRKQSEQQIPKYTFKCDPHLDTKVLKSAIKLTLRIVDNDIQIEGKIKNQSWFKKQSKMADIDIDPDYCKGIKDNGVDQLKIENNKLKSQLNSVINSM